MMSKNTAILSQSHKNEIKSQTELGVCIYSSFNSVFCMPWSAAKCKYCLATAYLILRPGYLVQETKHQGG